MALEQRVMFDGAAVATAADASVAADSIPQDAMIPAAAGQENQTDDKTQQGTQETKPQSSSDSSSGSNPADKTAPGDVQTEPGTAAEQLVSTPENPTNAEEGDANNVENGKAEGSTDPNQPETTVNLTANLTQESELPETNEPGLSDPTMANEPEPLDINTETTETEKEEVSEEGESDRSDRKSVDASVNVDNAEPEAHVLASYSPTEGAPVEVVFVDSSVTNYLQLVQDIADQRSLDSQPELTNLASGSVSSATAGGDGTSPTETGNSINLEDNSETNEVDLLAEKTDMVLAELSLSGSARLGDLEIFILDDDKDGITQITEIMAGLQGLSGVHIISHGKNGAVRAGSTWLGADNLDAYRDDIASWGESMSSEGRPFDLWL